MRGYIKASDFIAEWLKRKVSHVFGVQGGAVVHLFDSCESKGPKPIYCHHEQAAGFAAVAYARICGLGVCITTTGPGSSNSLTPLLGAWQDSIPVLFISGQTRASHTSYGKKVRQVGTQEAPILDMVRPIVKAGYFITDVSMLPATFECAYRVSISGRPGPVWIDLPVDVSWIESEALNTPNP